MAYIFKHNEQGKLCRLEESQLKQVAGSNKPLLLVMPGYDGVTHIVPVFNHRDFSDRNEKNDKIVSSYLKKFESVAKGHDADVLIAAYEDDEFYNRTKKLRSAYCKDNSFTGSYGGSSDIDTAQHEAIVNKLLMKLVTDETGKKLNYTQAYDNLSNLTLAAHSGGTAHAAVISNIMQGEMLKAGYSAKDTDKLLSNIHMVSTGTSIIISGNNNIKFRCVSFEAENDILMAPDRHSYNSKVNTPAKAAELIKDDKGNLTVIISNAEKFTGFYKTKLSREKNDPTGHNLDTYINYKAGENNIAPVMIENVIKNLLEGKGRKIEDVEDLLARENMKNKVFCNETGSENNFSTVRNIHAKLITQMVTELKNIRQL